jgi:hypothetical protein
VLLEREGDPAGSALARAAKDDDELFVPVAERALPAVPEPLPDPTEKDAASGGTAIPGVITKPGRVHRQHRERPAGGELLPQNAPQRRAVRQPRKLVEPARGVPGVLQGGGHLPGEELQGPLLLGAVLPAANDHGPHFSSSSVPKGTAMKKPFMPWISSSLRTVSSPRQLWRTRRWMAGCHQLGQTSKSPSMRLW